MADQLNDSILATTGAASVSDGLMAFYLANGATSGSVRDAAYEFLVARGIPESSSSDMWRTFLSGIVGVTDGTIGEMKAQWWALGAPLI